MGLSINYVMSKGVGGSGQALLLGFSSSVNQIFDRKCYMGGGGSKIANFGVT